MDKSWIRMPRNSPVYDEGVKSFIDFAFRHGLSNDMILCPCPVCGFSKWQTRAEVYDHLICKQFPSGYTIWYLHGESHPQETTYVSSNVEVASQSNVVVEDPIREMVNDAFGVHEHHSEEGPGTLNEGDTQSENVLPNMNEARNATDEFYELSNDGSSGRSRNIGDASGSQQAEIDSLKETVKRLTQIVQETEQRLQTQITRLKQQLGGENQNLPANEENVGSPVVGRSSSQGSHSATAQRNRATFD